MRARWRQLRAYLREAFWLRPALLVAGALWLGWFAEVVDRNATLPGWLGAMVYTGGAEGARGLLSALATSSIGVAGTIFSITIAALSLASGQMGPRLLRNFTRDPGIQLSLGAFLGTFAYALVVLRSIRGASEGDYVPHLAVSIGVLLGLVCVGVLVWFVHHAAEGINVDRVIDDVSRDLARTLACDAPADAAPAADFRGARLIRLQQGGYLQQLDTQGLAQFAAESGCMIRLLYRPGQRIHAGLAFGLVQPWVPGAEDAVRRALAVGTSRTLADDSEFAAEQLTEIAVRALSPGINDPNTAKAVVNSLTGILCQLAGCNLRPGHVARGDRLLLCWPATTYAGLLDTMFHLLRQNAAQSPAVIITLLEGLAMIAQIERDPGRLAALARHAHLAQEAGLAGTPDRSAQETISDRYRSFLAAEAGGIPSVQAAACIPPP